MTCRLSDLADRFGLELLGEPEDSVERVASLQDAGPSDISFYTGPRHRAALASTRAGAVILAPAYASHFSGNRLLADNPLAAYARIARELHPAARMPAGIHPQAIVATDARVDATASIGPGAVIEAGVSIGPGSQVGAGCFLGRGVVIGGDVTVHPNASLLHGTRVGDRCTIHSGAVLGADGFGHAREGEAWLFIPQLGNVVVGDDVSIGANTTIDRGTLNDTVIGNGVKLDNLIHIAHNVTVGAHTAMAAGCGIAGSTRIGERCTFAGQVGVADNLVICDDAHFTGRAVVLRDVDRPGVYSSGVLLDDNRNWRRNAMRFNQLDALFRQVRRLTKGNTRNGKPT